MIWETIYLSSTTVVIGLEPSPGCFWLIVFLCHKEIWFPWRCVFIYFVYLMRVTFQHLFIQKHQYNTIYVYPNCIISFFSRWFSSFISCRLRSHKWSHTPELATFFVEKWNCKLLFSILIQRSYSKNNDSIYR